MATLPLLPHHHNADVFFLLSWATLLCETLSSARAAQTSWLCSCFRFPPPTPTPAALACFKHVMQVCVTQDGVETKKQLLCTHTHTHALPGTKGPILRRGRRFSALTGSAGWSLRRSDRFPIFTLGFHIPWFRAFRIHRSSDSAGRLIAAQPL